RYEDILVQRLAGSDMVVVDSRTTRLTGSKVTHSHTHVSTTRALYLFRMNQPTLFHGLGKIVSGGAVSSLHPLAYSFVAPKNFTLQTRSPAYLSGSS
ncbi:MAG: hypothetical protein QXS27_05520, partial [Candidatus Jordarchaeaceae archaeon]